MHLFYQHLTNRSSPKRLTKTPIGVFQFSGFEKYLKIREMFELILKLHEMRLFTCFSHKIAGAATQD